MNMINRKRTKVFMKRILNASVYVVPVCLNTKAFLTKETEDNLAWIKYWLFFSLLFAFEILLNFHKSFFPCYDYFKVFILCVCIVSIELNLTNHINNESTTRSLNQVTNVRQEETFLQQNNEINKDSLSESQIVENHLTNVRQEESSLQQNDKINKDSMPQKIENQTEIFFETINPEAKNYICKENKSMLRKRKSGADFAIHRILSTADQAVYVMKFQNFQGNEKALLRRFMFTVRSFMLNRLP